MVYGDLQIFDIIVFAGIAIFLVFRLRNVLGKRTGFEKKPNNNVGVQPTKIKETKKHLNYTPSNLRINNVEIGNDLQDHRWT